MAEPDKTSFIPNINQGNESPDEYTVYTRESIGYADGYSSYKQNSAARTKDGNKTTTQITKPNAVEHVKSLSPELLLDTHSNLFRRINGYGKSKTSTSDAYEDPTYLIFDINIMKYESPLFREDIIKSFLDEYSDAVPELAERNGYWEEFRNILLKIFPSDVSGDGDGVKRHYIEAISGLDVLLNPIINYPEDSITITISEDIAMTLQYLAELYNNLIYSYDTHRYLIPDNLLRFNMRITVRDLRNMRNPIYNDDSVVNGVNENISKFIYVLHDCQFDFMKTKNFGADIKRAGFGAGSPPASGGGNVNINFKSYSKITAPLLIDNSKIVDFRERETKNDKGFYRITFNSDYKSQSEVIAVEKNNERTKNLIYRSATDIISTSNQDKRPGNLQFPEINTNIRGWEKLIRKEIVEVRDVIIKKIYEEVNILATQGQRFLGDRFGFTIGKVNVYYDSLQDKVTKFSFLFEQFLDDKVDDIMGRTREISQRNGNVYEDEPSYNQKYPDGDVHPDGQYNEKFPEGDLHEDGSYNEKYPEGDLHIDGSYNEKYPDGDVHPDGSYNQKFPDGDLHEDGQYNQKFPDGDLHEDGQYNEKYPEGDVHSDGQYNQKFPDGDLHEDGMYNEKFPDGDLHEDGQYNDKKPKGNIYNGFKELPPNIKDIGNVYKNNNQ